MKIPPLKNTLPSVENNPSELNQDKAPKEVSSAPSSQEAYNFAQKCKRLVARSQWSLMSKYSAGMHSGNMLETVVRGAVWPITNAMVKKEILDKANQNMKWNGEMNLNQDYVQHFPHEQSDLLYMPHKAGEKVNFLGCFEMTSSVSSNKGTTVSSNKGTTTLPRSFSLDENISSQKECRFKVIDSKSRETDFLRMSHEDARKYIDGYPGKPAEANALASFTSELGQTTSFIEKINLEKIPMAESFETAPKKEIPQEKIQAFKRQLQNEREKLVRLMKNNDFLDETTIELGESFDAFDTEYRSLIKAMDKMLARIDSIKFYEAHTSPIHGIPAVYLHKKDEIIFAKGTWNYNLVFHELGHAAQKTGKVESYKDQHDVQRSYHMGRIKNDEDHLNIEMQAHQWNVFRALMMMGYSSLEIKGIKKSLAELKYAQENKNNSGAQLTFTHCELAAGLSPTAYNYVFNLFEKITQIKGHSSAETKSLLALTAAYFNIQVSEEGIISVGENGMKKLLTKFYKFELHEH